MSALMTFVQSIGIEPKPFLSFWCFGSLFGCYIFTFSSPVLFLPSLTSRTAKVIEKGKELQAEPCLYASLSFTVRFPVGL